MKMSEEEQIERMKRNQERLSNRKKNPIATPSAQSQGLETKEEVCQSLQQYNWLGHFTILYTNVHLLIYLGISSGPLPSKGDTSCYSCAAIFTCGQTGFC